LKCEFGTVGAEDPHRKSTLTTLLLSDARDSAIEE